MDENSLPSSRPGPGAPGFAAGFDAEDGPRRAQPAGAGSSPNLSLVIPAYNEESILAPTLRRLLEAFEQAGIRLEVVVVDNGSRDRTGDIAREFAARHPGAVLPVRVEVNQGYGNGILQGIPHCTAPWIGFIPADGQVDAEDVVRLFEAMQACDSRVLGKVRRRFRLDGFKRKVVSIFYNGLVLVLWPGIGTLDVNGLPKILHRDVVRALDLDTRGWFLDPEIMIKARHLGVRVLELNVFSRMRGNGLSHVRPSTCWEFFRSLLSYRFTGRLSAWRRTAKLPPPGSEAPAAPAPALETATR